MNLKGPRGQHQVPYKGGSSIESTQWVAFVALRGTVASTCEYEAEGLRPEDVKEAS